MSDNYQVDFDDYITRDQANKRLKTVRTWPEFEDLYRQVWKKDFVLVSKRRKGVMIFHIQKADVKRSGHDLAFYLVNDGVHAGACAVPNLHKFFYFRKSTNAEWAEIKAAAVYRRVVP